ncbi:MAG: hypothetical protein E7662_10800 [Ruminococcaceae bacterium]|nr:hypothetical protein [Oscillospiraceae bacterium]
MVKKSLSLLLAILMLAGTFALSACSDDPAQGENNPADTSAPAADTTTAETTPAETEPPTPYDLIGNTKYDGYVYTVLNGPNTSKWVTNMIEIEETGEVLFDAVYQRNKIVEDKLGVVTKSMYMKDTAKVAMQAIAADDDAYQTIMLRAEDAASMAPKEYLIDIKTTGIDLEQPWFTQRTNQVNEIGGKLYMASSEMVATNIANTYVVFYNESLSKNLGTKPEDLYKIVLDGKWTIDKLAEMTKGAYKDLDGDNARSWGDQYGYALWDSAEAMTALQYGMGQGTGDIVNGEPRLTIISERQGQIISKLNSMFAGTDNVRYPGLNTADNGVVPIFREGRALFATVIMMWAYNGNMREMTDVYAALPTPKLDEKQEDYQCIGSSYFFMLPKTLKDAKKTANVLAALSYEGYNIVYPTFWEITMKTKFSDNPTIASIYDLINASRTLDFGYMYGNKYKLRNVIKECLDNKSDDYVSRYTAVQNATVEYMKEILKSYQ